VTSRADIYALACTLFELLTGRTVFEGTDLMEMLKAHASAPPPRISSVCPDYGLLDGPLLRALSKNPEARHATASEFFSEVEVAAKKIWRGEAPSHRRTLRILTDRIIVVEGDHGIRRRLESVITRVIRDAPRKLDVEWVETGADALASHARAPAAMVIIDEDSAGVPIRDLVARLGAANILVLSRTFQALRGVADAVPKPINVSMLNSVLERLVVKCLARSAPNS